MPYLSIVFGLLLSALGGYAYSAAEKPSMTALIPALEGVLLIVAGAVALKETLLKHAMHAAATVGLVGLLAGGGNLIRLLLKTEPPPPTPLALQANGGMAALSLVFVLLCVVSFIQARRRKQAQGLTPS